MSPDGNWVWDGTQWQPVTAVEPTHEGVFAAYGPKVEAAEQAVAAAPPMAAAAPVQVAPPAAQYQYPAPAPDYYPPAESVLPLWQQPKTSGKTVYLYAGGAVVLFLMVLIVLNTINFLSLPFIGGRTSSNPPVATKPSLSPSPVSRSESSRAEAFVTGSLGPALESLTATMAAVNACNGTMSNSCFNAINASDPQLKNVLSVIDHASIPSCIALTTANVRSDLVVMEAGLQLALKGYKDQVLSEVVDGVYRFTHYGQAMVANGHAVESAAQTYCNTDLEGP
jgi:hypothetical protein